MFTTVLVFRCRSTEDHPSHDVREPESPPAVFLHLEDAAKACPGRINIINTEPIHVVYARDTGNSSAHGDAQLPAAPPERTRGEESAPVSPSKTSPTTNPPPAIPLRTTPPAAAASDTPVNGHPYRPPRPVEAGGGILIRRGAGGREVLLIHRRGVWDLPKGKRDAGETLETCARREVCEELGLENVVIGRRLGRTVHGYVDGGHYAVKTTHWYQMHTDSDAFRPEGSEGITAALWMPWNAAIERLGFAVLRGHLEAIEPWVVDR